jgi:hypothetical protein
MLKTDSIPERHQKTGKHGSLTRKTGDKQNSVHLDILEQKLADTKQRQKVG